MHSLYEAHEIAGYTLGQLARIERGAQMIADRLWRGDYAEARPLIWGRIRVLCGNRRHCDSFTARRAARTEARDWLALLLRVRRDQKALALVNARAA